MFVLKKILVYLLSLFSFTGFVALFLIQNKVALFSVQVNIIWSYMAYIFLPILLSILTVYLIKQLPADDSLAIDGNDIVPVEGNLIPAYIGMFVISLSLPGLSVESLMISSLLLVLWLHIGSVSYFNPFLSVLGYRFYAVRSTGNKTMTVITKEKDLKQKTELSNLIRINNYTFFWSKK